MAGRRVASSHSAPRGPVEAILLRRFLTGPLAELFTRRSTRLLVEVFTEMVDAFAPPGCESCAAPIAGRGVLGPSLCGRCEAAIPWLGLEECCALCQRECAPHVHGVSAPRPRCGECAIRPAAPSSVTAAASHRGIAATAVHRLKYGEGIALRFAPGALGLVRPLVERLAVRAAPAPGAVLAPIPLHPTRLRARGFNQSSTIARLLGAHTGHRIDFDLLRRTRDTPSQTTLGRSERRLNLHGAFACQPNRAMPEHVCLVDDVTTTGATIEAAARELIRGGVARVDALCLTRASLTISARA